MVPPGVPDVIQIVVFAARPYAFLSRRRALVVPLFRAREDVLELIHPRVGEQQRRVVGRDQRRRAHNLVPTLRKVVQKLLADLVTCHFLYCGRLRGASLGCSLRLATGSVPNYSCVASGSAASGSRSFLRPFRS